LNGLMVVGILVTGTRGNNTERVSISMQRVNRSMESGNTAKDSDGLSDFIFAQFIKNENIYDE